MAETLGSLIDKLTIKCLREYHIREMKQERKPKFPKKELAQKLNILAKQKRQMFKEIDDFIDAALQQPIVLRDEKLKLYNKREVMGQVGSVDTLARAIEEQAQRNIRLWHLEDEARREDVTLDYIGSVKKKIDVVNQQRNDFIDLIDELFAASLQKQRNVKCAMPSKRIRKK